MSNQTVNTVYSIEEVFQLMISRGISSGGSFAIWRKPKSSKLEFILDECTKPEKASLNLEELAAGFIVHPFADQEDKKAWFIRASRYLSIDLTQPIDDSQLPDWVQNSIKDNPTKLNSHPFLSDLASKSSTKTKTDSEEKAHFIQLVKLGIQEIGTGKLEKVVPARTKTIPLSSGFDLSKSLVSMLKAYPNSFVNFFHIPEVGTWIGASPEILIETKGDLFYTMSLAGTQPAKGENPLKTAAWTQKEIEEQALVSRYIVDCFKKIRLREYEESGPKTVLAGTLLHLRSDFKVNMVETNFPQLGSVMLSLLHPTSAVCGMPREQALQFLKNHEGFDRSFFAGFIGPVNINQETSLYVNLRTASIQGDTAILYAGAGVTADSDPEKEWEETELKCQIIGKFIQNPSS
jgi:isochorismate synthase